MKGSKWQSYQEKQLDWISVEPELGKRPPQPEEELREHEQFIYQLAKVGSQLGNQIWVGKNEQNKSSILQKMSLRRLEIPGMTEGFIARNRINQIDLIWLNPDEGRYVAFEIENTTGIVPGIQRLANLTEKLAHIKIPTFIIIPDKLRNVAQKLFESPSGIKLGDEQRQVIVYSKLLHNIDLLDKKLIKPSDLLSTIAEPA